MKHTWLVLILIPLALIGPNLTKTDLIWSAVTSIGKFATNMTGFLAEKREGKRQIHE